MFPHIMVAPTVPLPHVDLINKKQLQQPSLYISEPYTVQIIQLVECSSPPPRIGSPINDSTPSSSSCDYSSDQSDDDEDEDEDSDVSSYCSSDLPPEEFDTPSAMDDSQSSSYSELSSEAYSMRMKRILAWRENFSAQMSATLAEPTLTSSLKRKAKCDQDDDDDNFSHSSKRSRSQASQGDERINTLGIHSCPACDTFFTTRQSLRLHGQDAHANEACSAAVQYAFE